MSLNSAHKNQWLTNFCETKQIFVAVVMIQIVVIIYALSSLSFDTRFLFSLSILTLLAQFIGMTLIIILCKLRKLLNQFNVVTGTFIVTAIIVIQTSLMAQIIGFLDLHLSLQLITGDKSINYINLKLTISSVIIGLALIRYFYVQDQWHRQVQKLSDARLMALQARIKPHFLFNSLNSIAALIGIDQEKAEIAIADFSDLMRQTFAHQDKFNTLSEELKCIEQYLAIEKLRLGSRLQHKTTCDSQLMKLKIPVLCLQPLVENAIIHGIQPLEKGGTIDIAITKNMSDLRIMVKNPYKKNNHTGSNKMALQNIQERLQLHYGNKAELKINKQDTEFCISLSIPL